MRKANPIATILILAMLLGAVGGPLLSVGAAPLGAVSPTLGAVASYSVLAGSIVTNTGNTTMPGNLGISPSIGAGPHYTGFPPGSVGPPGAIHDADVNAAAAQAADTAAFAALIAGPNAACDVTYAGVQELNGLSLAPGVYCADAFNLAGTLTLSDTGVADVWIFRSDLSTLNTTPGIGANVRFVNEFASPCNVWWRVASSASLGSGTAFIGNILALTSISLGTGASLNGRALAQTGAVTLDTNTFTGLTCLPAVTSTPTSTATGSPTVTSTGTATSTATNTPVPPPTNTPVPPPQNTPVPPPTETPPPAPTETETAPAVVGLPATGGGPLPGGEFPWSQALVVGGLGAIALGLGVGAYRRRARRPAR